MGQVRVKWLCLKLYCAELSGSAWSEIQPLLYFEYRISNKEFRTAEVFEKNKKMFFTSIFCGSLFCGSAVHILDDVIPDS